MTIRISPRLFCPRWNRRPRTPPTSGTGRFKNRRALREYERAKEQAAIPTSTQSAVQQASDGLHALQALRAPTDSEWRFSAHRFRQLQVQLAAAKLERSKSYPAASALYSKLLTQQPRNPWHIAQRLALCFDRMGEPIDGVKLCLTNTRREPLVTHSYERAAAWLGGAVSSGLATSCLQTHHPKRYSFHTGRRMANGSPTSVSSGLKPQLSTFWNSNHALHFDRRTVCGPHCLACCLPIFCSNRSMACCQHPT